MFDAGFGSKELIEKETRVKIHGLQSNTELNDKIGVVKTEPQLSKNGHYFLYGIKIEGFETEKKPFGLKRDNFTILGDDKKSNEEEEILVIEKKTRVKIHGLESATQYNNEYGFVVDGPKLSRNMQYRYVIKIEGLETEINVKRDNFTILRDDEKKVPIECREFKPEYLYVIGDGDHDKNYKKTRQLREKMESNNGFLMEEGASSTYFTENLDNEKDSDRVHLMTTGLMLKCYENEYTFEKMKANDDGGLERVLSTLMIYNEIENKEENAQLIKKLIPEAEKIVSRATKLQPSVEEYYKANFQSDDDKTKEKMNLLFNATSLEALNLPRKYFQEAYWYIMKDCRESGMVERVLEKIQHLDHGRPFVVVTGTSHVDYVYKKLKAKEEDIGRKVRTENLLIE